MAFNHCPNCGRKGRAFTSRNIYKCKECGKLYCHDCNRGRCPDCGSGKKQKAGHVR